MLSRWLIIEVAATCSCLQTEHDVDPSRNANFWKSDFALEIKSSLLLNSAKCFFSSFWNDASSCGSRAVMGSVIPSLVHLCTDHNFCVFRETTQQQRFYIRTLKDAKEKLWNLTRNLGKNSRRMNGNGARGDYPSKQCIFLNESDPRSDVHYLGSSENKAWKKFRPVRSWPLQYRCSALPTELTSQLGAGHDDGSK